MGYHGTQKKYNNSTPHTPAATVSVIPDNAVVLGRQCFLLFAFFSLRYEPLLLYSLAIDVLLLGLSPLAFYLTRNRFVPQAVRDR